MRYPYFNILEKINAFKAFMKWSVSLSLFSVAPKNIPKALSEYYHVAVILDGDCENLAQFLEAVDKPVST